MNVHVSYKAGKSAEVEREINQNIEKLAKRLQVFQPELIHLYATVSENARNDGISISLNLRLPSGQMATQHSGDNSIAAVKGSFQELIRQLQRHKELLRNERGWYRKRGGQDIPGVPFEETSAAVKLPPQGAKPESNGEVSSYINANLARLEQFIDRELRYREANGHNIANVVTREEVLDEVVATALSEIDKKPADLNVERWMYRLALEAIRRVAHSNREHIPTDGTVNIDGSAEIQNVSGSDESLLQFHQPDAQLHQEDVIPEHTYGSPEDLAFNDELVEQIERALRSSASEDRQAMMLFALEGFSVEEVAHVTDRTPDQVRASIEKGRNLLKQKLPAANILRDRLLARTTKIA